MPARFGVLNDVEHDCLARYVETLRQRLGESLRAVWVFGSVARGDVTERERDFVERVRGESVALLERP
jgi:predicted nucleotidyltransferase